jgi:ferrous iron transport protein B
MSEQERMVKIALVGNPNSGKSTVFNHLTGLRQKTGNFPGITVDIKEGKMRFPNGRDALIIDFPGTYSLYPTASDEKLVAAVLTNTRDRFFPDAILYLADVTHLEKHLLLFTQLLDFGLPMILALNMSDTAEEMGIRVNISKLAAQFKTPVIPISGRAGTNMAKLVSELEKLSFLPSGDKKEVQETRFYNLNETEKQIAEAVRLNVGVENPYRALLIAHHYEWLPYLQPTERETLAAIVHTKQFHSLRAQVDETLDRFDQFTPIVRSVVQQPPVEPENATDHLDTLLTHRIWAPVIFALVMLLVFQAVFDWSAYPMDAIDSAFASTSDWLKATLPRGWLTDLLTDGIFAGLSGILVFVPQIAFLFFLITILEEIGYMARVVFMFDKTMQRFGMNGRSVVSLISGSACAVPAIMSSRTIGNWQERLITVMVTPFISCSARIPVYLVLIGLAVPPVRLGGFINAQSLVFASMYALGVVAALLSGWAMKKWLHARERSYLAIELPEYRMPHWRNVWLTVWEKVSAFVYGAGKIILIVSVILWALSRFGPGTAIATAQQQAHREALERQLDSTATEDWVNRRSLEASYAGLLGKSIEPVIRPLGYDWKIGIALITSFAAREVFTGTLAVLYSIKSEADDINDRSGHNAGKAKLWEKMKAETFDDGTKVYSLATALSLLVFYALAMQCMSTLAVVQRETGSWKWAVFQFVFMSVLAYIAAWAVYQLFS